MGEKMSLTLDEYQTEAIRTAPVGFAGTQELELAIMGLGVAGEAGEVADLIKKQVGHGAPCDSEKMAKELGDVLWYLAVIAQRYGYTLASVAKMSVGKLRKRYPNGFSHADSAARVAEVRP